MFRRKDREEQPAFWIATSDLPTTPANTILQAVGPVRSPPVASAIRFVGSASRFTNATGVEAAGLASIRKST